MNLIEATYLCDELEQIMDNDMSGEENQSAIDRIIELQKIIKRSTEAVVI